ncbi:MAG: UDP-N-acetylglucosamine 1-carboxyvinyltransferase [Clostridia bacterium]|nr:UDP-N-acetylglucosamine 1-carboxyvinyltransferase [Clostridia bacterium]
MSCYIIEGGNRLSGEVQISGAKNAVLPILAAAATQRETTIKNIPFLSDVSNTLQILKKLGMQIKSEGSTVTAINSINTTVLDKELSQRMRSSVLFLGALLGRFGEVTISEPGGCQLGSRPIELHLWAMEQLGAEIVKNDDKIFCKGNLKGKEIELPIISVGVTENIILAAINAKGTTIIKNAAKEPEIDDLIAYLNKCGSKIRREKNTVVIEESNVESYCDYSVMSDRIEAGTYIAMAASTGGELFINNVNPSNIGIIIPIFEKTGCIIKAYKDKIYVDAPERLYSLPKIITKPYPYFPTDMQPQIMAVLSKSEGKCVVKETLFSARNKHIPELNKMGADIKIMDNTTFEIRGVDSLQGSEVYAKDLRGGAALLIAALGAAGESRIYGTEHIERGYEALCAKIECVGGKIGKAV